MESQSGASQTVTRTPGLERFDVENRLIDKQPPPRMGTSVGIGAKNTSCGPSGQRSNLMVSPRMGRAPPSAVLLCVGNLPNAQPSVVLSPRVRWRRHLGHEQVMSDGRASSDGLRVVISHFALWAKRAFELSLLRTPSQKGAWLYTRWSFSFLRCPSVVWCAQKFEGDPVESVT